jgi:hypothetical protein
MAEREKYYIGLNGQTFEVSKELYEAYYKGQRKEKYFTHDLKQEHIKVDKETGGIIVISSREDSYERLLEAEKQFAEEAENVEDVAVRAVMLEKPYIHLQTRRQLSFMLCSIRKSVRWNWRRN